MKGTLYTVKTMSEEADYEEMMFEEEEEVEVEEVYEEFEEH